MASLEALERHKFIDQTFFADLKSLRPNFATEISDIEEVYDELSLGKSVHELYRKGTDAERGNTRGDVAHAVFLATSKIIEEVARCRHLAPGSAEQTQAQREIDSAVNFVHENFTPRSGERIAGARLERIIGRGTFGTVWEADDELLGKKVAVKVFRLDELTESKKLHRFRRSIYALKMLSATHNLEKRTYERGSTIMFHRADATTLAFSMDLVDGGNLVGIERRGWTREKKIDIILDVCAAIEYSHSFNIIHRDIKPANVLLDRTENAVVTDFDVADVQSTTSASTSGEGMLGTPAFAAPEQFEQEEKFDQQGKRYIEKRDIDKRADIYSIGRLLLYLLLEKSPGFTFEVDPASKLVKEPQGLVEVVRTATQHDRTKRYADIGEMMRALERCMGWPARVDAYLSHTLRTIRRNWPLFTVTGCLLGGLVGGLSYQTIQAEEQRTLKEQAEMAQQQAIKAVAEAEALRESLTSVSEQLDRNMGEYCQSSTRKIKLESTLLFKRKRLAELPNGSIDANRLIAEIRKDEADLAGFEKRIAGLERSQVALRAKLKLAKKVGADDPFRHPEIISDTPFNKASSCSQRSLCATKGLCTFDGTLCVAGSDADCQRSDECKANGRCTAIEGHCFAETSKDCQESTNCGQSGLCSLSGQTCIAVKDADCTGKPICTEMGACTAVKGACRTGRGDCSDQCKKEGKCTLIDGYCYPKSDKECRTSMICDQRGLCFTDGWDCIAKRDSDCGKSAYCENFGQCALKEGKCR